MWTCTYNLLDKPFDFSLLIAPAILVILILLMIKTFVEFPLKQFLSVKIVMIIISLFLGFLSILSFQQIYFDNVYIVEKTKNGEYLFVEGAVSEFTTSSDGSGEESFKVNEILFSYPNDISGLGYNKRRALGGVIRENGQYVRIYYIPFPDENSNIIVKIELAV